MGKRKSTNLEADLEDKFRRFKEELLRKRRRRVLPLSSSSSDSDSESLDTVEQNSASSEKRRRILSPSPSVSTRRSRSRQKSTTRRSASRRRRSTVSPPRRGSSAQKNSSSSPSPEEPSASTTVVRAEVHEQPTPNKNDKSTEEIPLDDDILQLLGDAPKMDVALGSPIHKDVANRWQDVLSKGLTKEVRDKLLQEYLVPSNCELLLAPTLNPEAKAAISEMMVRRDSALMFTQKQLGIAISALAVASDLIISKESSTQKILKPISDACRLLCDIHKYETTNRRKFVISAINTTLKDTLTDSTRDKFLFGENLTDKLKAAQTIQKSGDSLKYPPQKTFTKNNFAYRNQNKNRLNWKSQHRKTDGKPFGDNSRGRPNLRAPPPPPPPMPRGSANAAYRPAYRSDRSPQRRTQQRRR